MNFWILLQRVFALFLFILLLPLFGILAIILKIQNGGPLIFKQKRMGKGKKPFTIYKIRTMVVDADEQKSKYLKLNEADGPVFKIKRDPRFTPIGRVLARTAVDEFPQLINVIKGEMAIVGPRPLPWSEALNVPSKYKERFTVLPGMSSTWIIKGSHRLSFKEWMKLDIEYVKNHSIGQDILIMVMTFVYMSRWVVHYFLSKCKQKLLTK